MNKDDRKKDDICHFCGRKAGQDGIIVIEGPVGANICNECAAGILKMTENHGGDCGPTGEPGDAGNAPVQAEEPIAPIGRIPTPSEIVKRLDEYVVGQDEAKRILAVAVYNHYCRLAARDGFDADGNRLPADFIRELGDVEIEKSNILMIGPTGCGKTMLARTIAKILNVPFAIADATTLTEAGYVGEDVENVVRYAYNNANRNTTLTSRAIIWIDEIDKIASKTQNVSLTRDVSGEGVQQALLKIVEGTICRFPPNGGRKHPDQQLVEVDTRDILFICGGAFDGLEKIVSARIGDGKHSIGFRSDSDDNQKIVEKCVRPEDLIKFGLIPEFVGRLPIVTEMKELTEDELMRVLTEPKNALTKQYRKLLKLSNVDVDFDEASLRDMARKAIDRKTGARGLKAEMEKKMQGIMFSIPDTRCHHRQIRVTSEMLGENVKDAA